MDWFLFFSVLIKTLLDPNNVELLKQFDFNDFNFGQKLPDSDNIIQNLLDSRFYDNDEHDDYLSYF